MREEQYESEPKHKPGEKTTDAHKPPAQPPKQEKQKKNSPL
jgi:hypothetical protein